jgi:transcriptional regulator with XRE-family HTH domain
MAFLSSYTDEVARKVTIREHELGDLLQQLRVAARMSRDQLAEAGGLSVGPIKRIETEGHIPKAFTLKLIAEGLATYAPGRRDDELAAHYYQRLMLAAGYVKGIFQGDLILTRAGADAAGGSPLRQALAFLVPEREVAEVDDLLRRFASLPDIDRRQVLDGWRDHLTGRLARLGRA